MTAEVLGGLAPQVLEGERELYCVDGGNSFDPYVFSTYARRRGVDPALALDRVFVTRTFTIHQLEAVAAQLLPPLAGRRPQPIGAVLGIEHLFLEESLALRERRQVLERIAGHLTRLRREGMMILLTHDPPMEGRGWWRPVIDRLADFRGTVHRTPEGLPDVRVRQIQ
ncbi:hypothetical protein KQI84_07030 [bacterium]|nr:hypothetical protein [bacterium]